MLSKKMNNQKGITIVSLVITIVVLLILAGVTISLVLGDRSIFTTAQGSVEKNKIAEYKEKVELSRIEVASQNKGEVTLDKLIEKIYEQKIVSEGSIEIINEEKAKMTTTEQYIFIITIEKIEYVGKVGNIPSVPEVNLSKGNIEIKIEPEGWTNQDIKVTMINNEKGEYTIQYSINKGITYTEYKDPITIGETTTIYVRLMNPIGDNGAAATYEITNIDKLPPQDITLSTTATINSITINTGEVVDAEATDKCEKSEIKEIWYSIDDGVTWETNEDKTLETYTFGSLTQNTTYKIKVKVIDNAENERITETQEVKTIAVNYGTSVQSNYATLYTTTHLDGFNGNSNDTYYSGNYNRPRALYGNMQEASISNGKVIVSSGTNNVNFSEQIENRWVGLLFRCGGLTTGVNMSALKLNFSDSTSLTLTDAVVNGYIEPLVICSSSAWSSSYVWNNYSNILTGGACSTGNYPEGMVMFKVKNKAKIKGITFNTNRAWNSSSDFCTAVKYKEGYEISTEPMN